MKGSAKRNAIFSERFDLIESAFYLFGFSRQVSKHIFDIVLHVLFCMSYTVILAMLILNSACCCHDCNKAL